MPRLHQICSSDTSFIHLHPFVSPDADYMYPLSATKLSLTLHYGDIVSTCIRIHRARPGYLYPATCVWCRRGSSNDIVCAASVCAFKRRLNSFDFSFSKFLYVI